MKIIHFFCVLFCLLCLQSIFSACSSLNRNGEKKQKIFRFNVGDGISSLDPIHAETEANVHIISQFYNGLFEYDEKLHLQPCLAEAYDISADGKTYTIALKKGVFFHDNPAFFEGRGRELKASDVVFSFKRLLDPASGSAGGWVFKDRMLKNSDGTVSDTCFMEIDEYALKIYLQEPFMPFLQLLTMPFTYIVPEEAVKMYGDLKKNPVGSGAFIFGEWLEYNYMRLRKNPFYFKRNLSGQQLPLIDAVEVSFMTDEHDAFKAFENNKIDYISGLTSEYINKVINKDGTINADFSNKYHIDKVPIINTEYIGILLDNKQYADNPNHPLLDIRVRKALNYVINREEIIEELRRNLGKPAHGGLVPPILSGDENAIKGYSYNPKKAEELLAEAGYPKGKGLPELTFYTIPSAFYLAEYVQAKFRQFGIQSKIEINNGPGHIGLINTGQAKIFRVRWLADYPDAENYLALFNSKNLAPGPNKTRYVNPAYDSLYAKACAEKVDSTRKKLYRQMEQMMMDDAPVIPIYYDEALQLSQNRVIGTLLGGAYNFKLEKIDINLR